MNIVTRISMAIGCLKFIHNTGRTTDEQHYEILDHLLDAQKQAQVKLFDAEDMIYFCEGMKGKNTITKEDVELYNKGFQYDVPKV